jgi:hypothetical protein
MQQMQLQRLLTQLGRAPRTLLQLPPKRLQMLHAGQQARQTLPGRAQRKLLLMQQRILLMLAATPLMQLPTLLSRLGSAPRMQLLQLLSV